MRGDHFHCLLFSADTAKPTEPQRNHRTWIAHAGGLWEAGSCSCARCHGWMEGGQGDLAWSCRGGGAAVALSSPSSICQGRPRQQILFSIPSCQAMGQLLPASPAPSCWGCLGLSASVPRLCLTRHERCRDREGYKVQVLARLRTKRLCGGIACKLFQLEGQIP
jgi:hypothetical protein